MEDRTYRLVNKSGKYDKALLACIARIVKKIKSEINAHFFDSKDSISNIGFIATFNLASDNNRIHDEAAMWV